ncbi:MAG: GH3 auxin-responsive promoter family protein [Deltaproteobacteria bacterium]|nr:GH3 auxin-responsive promoter family protein [Deltaproteobacteria bacterium]
MNAGATAANGLWALSCLSGALAFHRATGAVAHTQERLLRACLARNADTVFGRRHGFARIRSVCEYRERVPLSTYEDYRDAVGRIAAGEPGVLTREPVLLLEPTSGSTEATKLIPYTARLKTEFQRALAPWVANVYREHPGLLGGQAYWSLSPVTARDDRVPGGVPIGFDDDAEYLGPVARRLARSLQAVPAEVRLLSDLEAFWYATLLFLLRCEHLALVSVWSPTFLTLLLGRLAPWQERLAADVAAGTFSAPVPVDPALARRLSSGARPDPRRADRLRAAFGAGRSPGEFHAALWPSLGVVSCWADGNSRTYAAALAELLPQARLQPKGLVATEGIVSFPLPGRSGAALAVRSHFFEFLPEGGRGEPRLAHELEAGRTYSVVLTTGGGLYRYRLRDRIEVVGHFGQCPLLRFLGKEDQVSDWFGEKLDEGHVREVLDAALARQGLGAAFALLACEPGGSPAAYTLFLESPGADQSLLAVASDLEAALGANYHYRYCRALGQLGPVRVFRVAGGGAEACLRACADAGQRLGDVKPALLSRRGGWSSHFRGHFVPALPRDRHGRCGAAREGHVREAGPGSRHAGRSPR